jgi:hypothetical protein
MSKAAQQVLPACLVYCLKSAIGILEELLDFFGIRPRFDDL